jgi:hypothetical protein
VLQFCVKYQKLRELNFFPTYNYSESRWSQSQGYILSFGKFDLYLFPLFLEHRGIHLGSIYSSVCLPSTAYISALHFSLLVDAIFLLSWPLTPFISQGKIKCRCWVLWYFEILRSWHLKCWLPLYFWKPKFTLPS